MDASSTEGFSQIGDKQVLTARVENDRARNIEQTHADRARRRSVRSRSPWNNLDARSVRGGWRSSRCIVVHASNVQHLALFVDHDPARPTYVSLKRRDELVGLQIKSIDPVSI